jgi:hypothetical protein
VDCDRNLIPSPNELDRRNLKGPIVSKNLVIFCDGTNNEFGRENTNVVRLAQILDREGEVSVDLDEGGVDLLIRRRGFEVAVERLRPGELAISRIYVLIDAAQVGAAGVMTAVLVRVWRRRRERSLAR